MAMRISEVREWMRGMPDEAEIAIDEGGLTLIVLGSADYLEIGREPEPDQIIVCEGCNRSLHPGLDCGGMTALPGIQDAPVPAQCAECGSERRLRQCPEWPECDAWLCDRPAEIANQYSRSPSEPGCREGHAQGHRAEREERES